tara:strand:- start:375 stop:782 length:408 start_codon:yes stop_codon:yes gene_type:complete
MFFVTCGEMQSGFQMTLENGWIVSIMFGTFARSSNHQGWKSDCFDWDDIYKSAEARATLAEIWAIHKDYSHKKEELLPTEKERKNYYLANHYPENPLGYQNTTEVFNFIKHVSNLPLPSLRIMGLEARKKEETDG